MACALGSSNPLSAGENPFAEKCFGLVDDHYRDPEIAEVTLEYCQQAIELDKPETEVSEQAFFNLGYAYSVLKEFDKSVDEFTNAIEAAQRNGRTYSAAHDGRGYSYIQLGSYSDAAEDFNTVVRTRPNDYQGYKGRGDAYLAMKDYERAFADYSHALEIAPENPELYIRRAHVLKGLSRVDEALADLQEAWRRDPRLVSFLQQQLKAAGLYDGEVNGIPDEATVESVRQWIAQNNR